MPISPRGTEVTIIGVVGDKNRLSTENLISFKDVDRIVPVTETYKLANKKFHPEPSTVRVGNTSIGPGTLTIMAGPCAVEGEEQLMLRCPSGKGLRSDHFTRRRLQAAHFTLLIPGAGGRGPALHAGGREGNGPCHVCEVVSHESLEAAVKYVDMIQIGARNMQNFILLKEAGRSGLPVLLKRGLSATIEEWLNAAEYIIAEGNPNVVLCERGIRTFETATRNTLDISAVPVLKEKTHLPVIVDPSHASGVYKYVHTAGQGGGCLRRGRSDG